MRLCNGAFRPFIQEDSTRHQETEQTVFAYAGYLEALLAVPGVIAAVLAYLLGR